MENYNQYTSHNSTQPQIQTVRLNSTGDPDWRYIPNSLERLTHLTTDSQHMVESFDMVESFEFGELRPPNPTLSLDNYVCDVNQHNKGDEIVKV